MRAELQDMLLTCMEDKMELASKEAEIVSLRQESVGLGEVKPGTVEQCFKSPRNHEPLARLPLTQPSDEVGTFQDGTPMKPLPPFSVFRSSGYFSRTCKLCGKDTEMHENYGRGYRYNLYCQPTSHQNATNARVNV